MPKPKDKSVKHDFFKTSAQVTLGNAGVPSLLSHADVSSTVTSKVEITLQMVDTVEKNLKEVREKVKQCKDSMELNTQLARAVIKENRMLWRCLEMVENQVRSSNIRILGFPEDINHQDLHDKLQEWMQKALKLDMSANLSFIEWAYRIPASKLYAKQISHTIIVKFSSEGTCDAVLRDARQTKDLTFGGKKILIFPDLSPETQGRRKAFLTLKAELSDLNIKADVLYPAKLKVEFQSKTYMFWSPMDVEWFLAGRKRKASSSDSRNQVNTATGIPVAERAPPLFNQQAKHHPLSSGVELPGHLRLTLIILPPGEQTTFPIVKVDDPRALSWNDHYPEAWLGRKTGILRYYNLQHKVAMQVARQISLNGLPSDISVSSDLTGRSFRSLSFYEVGKIVSLLDITVTCQIYYVAEDVSGIEMGNPEADSSDLEVESDWGTRHKTVIALMKNITDESKLGFGLDKITHCQQRSPKNPEQKIIKRVIALEGDIIKTEGYKKRFVKIPDGHFWIEGDHSGHSFDSNAFGPVSLGLLHARASHIIWPPSRWRRLQPHFTSHKPLLDETPVPKNAENGKF
nr:PREDICTED: uncharacterized protein LOC106705948 [Latimeria chalumnae]|eukprot:XP_014351620.1 PREDICTED: uncharacterized protein LOC106705948 [Latimeria chalumnae]